MSAPSPGSASRVARLGAERWNSRAAGHRFVATDEESRPHDLDDAYALQHAYITASAGRVAGYKVAATNPTTRATTGLPHPCYGTLLSRDITCSPSALPWGRLQNPKIEAEIAFRIGRDLPEVSLDSVDPRDYIDAVMPAVELADDRHAPRPINPLELIAENAFQSAVILGAEIADWRRIDLAAIAASITIDQRPSGRGISADISGNPLNSLAWLIGALADHGRHLEPGMIVMSGCMIVPPAIASGETAIVDYGPYGTVELHLEDA